MQESFSTMHQRDKGIEHVDLHTLRLEIKNHPSPPGRALGAVELYSFLPTTLYDFIGDDEYQGRHPELLALVQRYIDGDNIAPEEERLLQEKFDEWYAQRLH